VWVACRVPDDCISGHAHHSRIHRFPLNDKENCIYSPDVISFARSQGYFDGKDEDFSFSLAYAIADCGALRGCDGRVWAYFNRFNNSMESSLPWILAGEGEPMPLWVKPDKKVSVREMQWMMRDHFEDTPMDMTKDVGAGPYGVPYRWRPLTYKVDGVEYTHERAIATQQTAFSFVAQLRDKVPAAMKGVLWFGVDDTNTCVYVPVYNCVTKAPHCYEVGNGDMYHISWDAAFWAHNYVANQAYNRYSQMIPDIRRVQNGLEDAIEVAVKEAEKKARKMSDAEARTMLVELTNHWAEKSTRDFKALGDYLLVKYLDGNVKKEKDGEFEYSPDGMPVYPSFPGYDERYYRSIVKDAGDRLKVFTPAINEK
jgi:dipeptidase